MLITSKQGKRLKKHLTGKKSNDAIRTLDQVVSALHKCKLFLAEREAIRITLNRDEGLSLEYPSSSVEKDRYIMLIRRDGKSDNRYRVLHFPALEPVKYRDKEY